MLMAYKNPKIAAIVVTYNRKEYLSQCLSAIEKQSYIPHTVFIIDNASTDETDVFVKENGFNNAIKEGIQYKYVRLSENIGGAGGFYTGMKLAYDSKECFDAFWVMDDDGVPESNQLSLLVSYLQEYDYISPLVLDEKDHNHMAFGPLSVNELIPLTTNGIMVGRANPFNGILFSRRLIEKVGYPEKNMFIWGDEWQYHLRIRKAGFTPITVNAALHYHPKDKQPVVTTRGDKKIVLPEQEWKLYCYCRNKVYYHYVNYNVWNVIRIGCKIMMDYFYYFYKHNFRTKHYCIVCKAVADGVCKNLNNLKHYM